MTFARLVASCLIAAACAAATPSLAQSVKVGMLLPMTGPFTSTGKQLIAGDQ
jgi:branched-chain amino acid transport system substrate-binding protein